MIDLKNIISLPTYTTNVPSTGEEVSFRPFVVKEEKILLMAVESKNPEQILSAIKTVFESCFFNKLNFDDMTYFDIEYLFIKLRMKSMGEVVEIIVKDPETKARYETEMKLDNIKIINLDDTNKNNLNIKLSDELGVTIKYPSLKQFTAFTDENKTTTELTINFIANSIDKIYTKTQVFEAKEAKLEEVVSFIENLPKEMFVQIANFFKKMPMVVYEDEYTTPTGSKIPIFIKDFRNFFV